MDRNTVSFLWVWMGGVALRKESVDRNARLKLLAILILVSLSARRAWIEISGSLDDILAGVSLSARRAWIEIVVRY